MKIDGCYIALQRALGPLVYQCFCGTFLSTDSRIQVFAPKRDHDPLGRISWGAKQRLPRFTGFQLDIEKARIKAGGQQEELQRPIATFRTHQKSVKDW